MKQVKESQVLSDVYNELKRFESKLELIMESNSKMNKQKTGYMAGLKRAAIDLKKELNKITTSSGTSGIYYYKYQIYKIVFKTKIDNAQKSI